MAIAFSKGNIVTSFSDCYHVSSMEDLIDFLSVYLS